MNVHDRFAEFLYIYFFSNLFGFLFAAAVFVVVVVLIIIQMLFKYIYVHKECLCERVLVWRV